MPGTMIRPVWVGVGAMRVLWLARFSVLNPGGELTPALTAPCALAAVRGQRCDRVTCTNPHGTWNLLCIASWTGGAAGFFFSFSAELRLFHSYTNIPYVSHALLEDHAIQAVAISYRTSS